MILTPPKPCPCGAPGIRNLGSRGYCPIHLAELYAKFDPAVFALNGRGMQTGPLRPDWGHNFADLECNSCAATWTGPIDEKCWWCERARIRLIEWQAEKVLEHPEVDPDDIRYPGIMAGWFERLAVATTAGIVTKEQAHLALRRQAKAS